MERSTGVKKVDITVTKKKKDIHCENAGKVTEESKFTVLLGGYELDPLPVLEE